ncbi:MAG TPA: PhzF family phenazine biosynthesis protein [Bacillota bacterium]
MGRQLPFLWVDVFTARPFGGNGLCVVFDAGGLTGDEMQALARETNQSETTFVLPPTRPGADYRVRIFTPGRELPFAGHPTLGTAAALVATGRLTGPRLVQETASGLTPLEIDRDLVVMETPSPRAVAPVAAERVSALLGAAVHDPEVIEAGIAHMVVGVEAVETLAALTPDLAGLTRLSQEAGFVGTVVYAPHAPEPQPGGAPSSPEPPRVDPVPVGRVRMFAPAAGVGEDPATGSAVAPLVLWLQRRGRLPRGAFTYEQGVEMGRPSLLHVEVLPGGRIRAGGRVVVLGEGVFRLL